MRDALSATIFSRTNKVQDFQKNLLSIGLETNQARANPEGRRKVISGKMGKAIPAGFPRKKFPEPRLV